MGCINLFFLVLLPWPTAGLLWHIRQSQRISSSRLHFDLSDGETTKQPQREEKLPFAKEALLIFDRKSYHITTQQQVDDFYSQKGKLKELKTTWNTSLATFSNVEGTDAVIRMLENAVWYLKYRNIKLLDGSKINFIRSAVEANIPYLEANSTYLRRAVVSTLYSVKIASSLADAVAILSIGIKLLKLAHKRNICFDEKDIALMLNGLQVRTILLLY